MATTGSEPPLYTGAAARVVLDEQVTNDRRYSGLVQIGGYEYRGVWIGIVVPLDQLQGPAANPAGCIDLCHRQLGGALHGNADRVAQRARETDPRPGSREKLQAQRASVSDATHSFPIDFTMLDWTDRAGRCHFRPPRSDRTGGGGQRRALSPRPGQGPTGCRRAAHYRQRPRRRRGAGADSGSGPAPRIKRVGPGGSGFHLGGDGRQLPGPAHGWLNPSAPASSHRAHGRPPGSPTQLGRWPRVSRSAVASCRAGPTAAWTDGPEPWRRLRHSGPAELAAKSRAGPGPPLRKA